MFIAYFLWGWRPSRRVSGIWGRITCSSTAIRRRKRAKDDGASVAQKDFSQFTSKITEVWYNAYLSLLPRSLKWCLSLKSLLCLKPSEKGIWPRDIKKRGQLSLYNFTQEWSQKYPQRWDFGTRDSWEEKGKKNQGYLRTSVQRHNHQHTREKSERSPARERKSRLEFNSFTA